MSELTYDINHNSTQQGEWFDYTGFRFKDWYDIELKDGRILTMCRPNADAWYAYNGQRATDAQVKRVRLKPDSELDPERHYVGQDRIDLNNEMFDIDP